MTTSDNAAKTTSQPQAAMKMDVLPSSAGPSSKQSQQCEHKAQRIRGGGAGKDCLLGCIGCFLCFECCEGCCDCVADIICCPCEMCC